MRVVGQGLEVEDVCCFDGSMNSLDSLLGRRQVFPNEDVNVRCLVLGVRFHNFLQC